MGLSCVHSYLIRSLKENTLQLSDNSSFDGLRDNGNSEKEITTRSPSDFKIETQSFERKPTAGIQEIAEKPFTVNHIDKFTTKAGELMVIVDTVEKFENIEYKNEKDEKVKGTVSRFFASPFEVKKLFGDDKVIEAVNEKGDTIRTMIEKVPFTAEEIARKASLKGKTHYVFRKVPEIQGKLGV